MKKQKFIFGSLAGILFMAFVTVNFTVSQSYNKDGTAQLTLTELAAKAQWEGEETVDYYLYMESCDEQFPDCYENGQCCYPTPGWDCDINNEIDCSWLCM